MIMVRHTLNRGKNQERSLVTHSSISCQDCTWTQAFSWWHNSCD